MKISTVQAKNTPSVYLLFIPFFFNLHILFIPCPNSASVLIPSSISFFPFCISFFSFHFPTLQLIFHFILPILLLSLQSTSSNMHMFFIPQFFSRLKKPCNLYSHLIMDYWYTSGSFVVFGRGHFSIKLRVFNGGRNSKKDLQKWWVT